MDVVFDVSGNTLAANSYLLDVWMNNLQGGGIGGYASFDGVELNAIPEPGTATLLGIGLAGLAFMRRRGT